MVPELCIGIASTDDTLEIAAIEPGKAAITITFPAGGMGVEAIKVFLAGYAEPVRLAVAGVAAASLALAVGAPSRRETFIVSPSVAGPASALARYAGHAV